MGNSRRQVVAVHCGLRPSLCSALVMVIVVVMAVMVMAAATR